MEVTLVVETENVTKVYGNQTVVDKVNLSLSAGSIHAVVGPNGAGKSTLFKLIIGLLNPNDGQIRLFGKPVESALRQRIHFVSPEVGLYPLFRVENVLRYASLMYERWDVKRCKTLVEGLQLPLKKTVRQLSLGMKMRLRLTIALAAQADVLLMDEATNGIDPATKEQILDLLLQEVANRDTAVLMATHDLSEVERIADTVTILLNGRILDTTSLDDIGDQYHEVQMTVSGKVFDRVLEVPELKHSRIMGTEVSAMMTGDESEIRRTLESLGAEFVEIRSATVGRWFTSVLQKEGIAGDKISLPESTRL